MRAYVRKAKWVHVLIPLVVLTLYFVSFSLFLSWLLPEYDTTVNTDFVSSAWKYTLVAAGLYLIFLVLFRALRTFYLVFERHLLVEGHKENRTAFETRGAKKLALKTLKNSIEKLDFILILLPLAPVLQYIVNNQDILSPLGALYVFAVFLGFSVLFIIVIPTSLGITGSTKTLMILGMAFTFTITNMASLSAEFRWFERGNLAIELSLLGAVFLIGWILYNLTGRKFLYFLVAVFFIANSATQLASQGGAKTGLPSTDNKLVKLVGSRRPLSTPSIYLLLYDAYVANETMLGHGIDNSPQEEYLETLGFQLYPHTYSIASDTIRSMSLALNASTEFYGSRRKACSGDGIVQNLLKDFGYETNGVFDNDDFFQGIVSSYDFSFPKASPYASGPKLLTKAIFMGEFRFDVEVNKPSYAQFVEHKLSILENVQSKPRFVYTHVLLPTHSQFSGACRPNETALFEERLVRANYEMKRDIETITQKDPGAIIVVAGDHGPYLTKNCTWTARNLSISQASISRLDIQDRFGAFLAIKWPTEDFSEYDDITVLQDVFPAVFAYLFKDNSLLDAKVASTTLGLSNLCISGASVDNGIIHGGMNDGEPLFVNQG